MLALSHAAAVVRNAPAQLLKQQHLEVDAQTAVSAKCGVAMWPSAMWIAVCKHGVKWTFVITSVTL